jgi:Holliday junction DNA helicase RuvA
VPGIGKKTAERLLLELKGKLGADLGAVAGVVHSDARPTSSTPCWRWAIRQGSDLAMKQVPKDSSVSDGIKLALKALSKG